MNLNTSYVKVKQALRGLSGIKVLFKYILC